MHVKYYVDNILDFPVISFTKPVLHSNKCICILNFNTKYKKYPKYKPNVLSMEYEWIFLENY